MNDALYLLERYGAGEIYLTCMDKDGTGFGYDLDIIDKIPSDFNLPIIMSGGVGTFDHLLEGLKLERVTGASTANLFNFIVGGLKSSISYLKSNNIPLANWA